EHGLELEEDLDLHERGWVLQKIGWAFILGVIGTAALGLYGDGVLSTRKPTSGNFTLEYERFNRFEHEMEVLIQSSGEPINAITLPQSYLKDMRLVRIVPEPENNVATDRDVTYHFVGDHNIISVYVRPESPGTFAGTLRINNGASFDISQFIYP
ncbi:MAG TPA: hypothetical protein VEY71_12855, partial [Chitinophagales bacterium]|nr:hypothetical protein [Chitinophagales bacterium]